MLKLVAVLALALAGCGGDVSRPERSPRADYLGEWVVVGDAAVDGCWSAGDAILAFRVDSTALVSGGDLIVVSRWNRGAHVDPTLHLPWSGTFDGAGGSSQFVGYYSGARLGVQLWATGLPPSLAGTIYSPRGMWNAWWDCGGAVHLLRATTG